MIVIGYGVVINLGNAAFLCAHYAGKIAPMVDDEWHVGIGRFADRLAVVESFNKREQIEIGFQLVSNLVEDARTFLNRCSSPGVLGLVCCVKREFNIGSRRPRNLTKLLASYGAWIVKIPSFGRRNPFSPDEIVVTLANEELLRDGAGIRKPSQISGSDHLKPEIGI